MTWLLAQYRRAYNWAFGEKPEGADNWHPIAELGHEWQKHCGTGWPA